MAFNSGLYFNDSRQACLYSALNPNSVYATATGQLVHENSNNSQQTMIKQSPTGPPQGSSCFSQAIPLTPRYIHGNEQGMFPVVPLAGDAGYSQFYGTYFPTLSPAVQMTTDYTGLLDASYPLKSAKPVHPFYWRKSGNPAPAEGMTRTKDKYRVVYTDKQRVGLEKEFKENKFITMKRKSELSKELDLSERQVKIWFQNRRAKERRQRRKAETEEVDHVMPDELPSLADELSDENTGGSVQTNDLLDVDLSSHNYPVLQSLKEPSPKNQCRFQENEDIHYDSKTVDMIRSKQDLTVRRFPTSPSEWGQVGSLSTTCNVSPFTANPDWNLVYRT